MKPFYSSLQDARTAFVTMAGLYRNGQIGKALIFAAPVVEEAFRGFQVSELLRAPLDKTPNMFGAGPTYKQGWERIAIYCDHLSERTDAPNVPDVYRLLTQNAQSIANGEKPTPAQERFGEQAKAYAEKGFAVPRNRHLVGENGEINYRGGVTDGQFLQDGSFLEALVTASFGWGAEQGICQRSVSLWISARLVSPAEIKSVLYPQTPPAQQSASQ